MSLRRSVGLGLAAAVYSGLTFASEGMGEMAVSPWAPVAAGIAIGLGALGAATGQGKAASAALEGIARNPNAKNDVFMPLILSLVFMEFQALLAFVIAFLVKG